MKITPQIPQKQAALPNASTNTVNRALSRGLYQGIETKILSDTLQEI